MAVNIENITKAQLVNYIMKNYQTKNGARITESRLNEYKKGELAEMIKHVDGEQGLENIAAGVEKQPFSVTLSSGDKFTGKFFSQEDADNYVKRNNL